MRFHLLLIASAALLLCATPSHAGSLNCDFDTAPTASVEVSGSAARLVARLVNPPRTPVTLSIDDENGNHSEMVWDPALGEGLQHDLLLHGGSTWTLTPSVEDERIQSPQIIIVYNTVFTADVTYTKSRALKGDVAKLTLSGKRQGVIATSSMAKLGDSKDTTGSMSIVVICEEGQVEMKSLKLDSKRVAAAAAARGLFDQTVSAPVTEALSILAEIAIDRAKAGAMELVRSKFVEPMCAELRLETLGLPGTSRAFPRTCSLLQQLRLDDVLSSGRSLVSAAMDDIRLTIAPALLSVVIANDETRGLAGIALDFANRMLDGESNTVIEVDLLVSLLDHLPWSTGFERSETIVLGWLDTLKFDDGAKQDLVRAALDRALPEQFWNDPRSPLIALAACKRRYRDLPSWTTGAAGTFPNGYFFEPDRVECIDAMLRTVFDKRDALAAISTATQRGYMRIENLALELSARSPSSLAEYLAKAYRTGEGGRADTEALVALLPKSAEPMLANACAIRLVVGIAKWCSGRETCAAGDVAEGLDNPRKLFRPTNDLPESLCWTGAEGKEKFRLPATAPKFIELGVRLVAFLKPATKGEERARALAMVRWLFAVVRTVNQEPLVDRFEEIVSHLLEPDYLRAITAAFTLANEVCTSERCKDLPAVKKALELVGAVASYAQTYEETKTLNSDEARKARKKALESLINAATDRTGRGGKTVYSIGSPVGFAVGLRLAAGKDSDYGSTLGAYDGTGAFQWRLPLAISRQTLPADDGVLGTHLALWIADLGHFARTRPSGTTDEIEWKDFLGIGLQAGFLLGTSSHSLVLAVEGSWAPGGFARDVTVRTPTETRVENLSGSFSVGLTVAYYVPIFDLN